MCGPKQPATPIIFAEEDFRLHQEANDMREQAIGIFVRGDLGGEELVSWMDTYGPMLPSAADLVTLILEHIDEEGDDDIDSVEYSSWALPSAQGLSLILLTNNNEEEQVEMLRSIQRFCFGKSFPSCTESYSMIQTMFETVFAWGLVTSNAIMTWKNDVDQDSYGMPIALEQTRPLWYIIEETIADEEFVNSILSQIPGNYNEDDEEDEEDDDDDDDDDDDQTIIVPHGLLLDMEDDDLRIDAMRLQHRQQHRRRCSMQQQTLMMDETIQEQNTSSSNLLAQAPSECWFQNLNDADHYNNAATSTMFEQLHERPSARRLEHDEGQIF